MEAVLDSPVGTNVLQQVCWRALLWGEAGHPVAQLMVSRISLEVESETLNAGDLSHVREVEVVIERGAGPDPADLDAAMTFAQGLMLGGGKPRFRGFGLPSSVGLLAPRS